jgi:hypothetical protein
MLLIAEVRSVNLPRHIFQLDRFLAVMYNE